VNNKVIFNPRLEDHLKRYTYFRNTGRWNVCPFVLEEPYKTIPEMCDDKVVILSKFL
jgi:hypothetical protein